MSNTTSLSDRIRLPINQLSDWLGYVTIELPLKLMWEAIKRPTRFLVKVLTWQDLWAVAVVFIIFGLITPFIGWLLR